jgi:hypothetical protein
MSYMNTFITSGKLVEGICDVVLHKKIKILILFLIVSLNH